jgi:hypothetical protein
MIARIVRSDPSDSLGGGVADFPSPLPASAVADDNRPVVEQIPPDRHRIMPVMVLRRVVGLKGDRQQIIHIASFFSRDSDYRSAKPRDAAGGRATPGRAFGCEHQRSPAAEGGEQERGAMY